MIDKTHHKGGTDAPDEAFETAQWTRKAGTAREVLKGTIDDVGDHVHDAEQPLQDRESPGSAHPN